MAADWEDLITVREASRQCHRTTETVRRWVWEGRLAARKLGNQLFVKRADVARLCPGDRALSKADRVAVLNEARTVRDRIAHRIGGTIDILEVLDRSREAHP